MTSNSTVTLGYGAPGKIYSVFNLTLSPTFDPDVKPSTFARLAAAWAKSRNESRRKLRNVQLIQHYLATVFLARDSADCHFHQTVGSENGHTSMTEFLDERITYRDLIPNECVGSSRNRTFNSRIGHEYFHTFCNSPPNWAVVIVVIWRPKNDTLYAVYPRSGSQRRSLGASEWLRVA